MARSVTETRVYLTTLDDKPYVYALMPVDTDTFRPDWARGVELMRKTYPKARIGQVSFTVIPVGCTAECPRDSSDECIEDHAYAGQYMASVSGGLTRAAPDLADPTSVAAWLEED